MEQAEDREEERGVVAGTTSSRRGPPGVRGRLARRRVSPSGEDESPLPALALAAGLGSLTLLPALGWPAILLAPFAVVCGALDRTRCRLQGRESTWMGNVGYGIGLVITAPLAFVLGIAFLPRLIQWLGTVL